MVQSVGLAELIAKVKHDLLSTAPGGDRDTPLLFVDSVELELQVTVQHEASTGIKIDVVAIGGAEIGGDINQEKVHTIKVNMSPLFSKEQLVEWYKDLYPDKVLPTIKQNFDGLMKGEQSESLNKMGA
ncbi:MAG: trypco2 family protein [Cyanobacteria bacterium P01_A01_bin.17]